MSSANIKMFLDYFGNEFRGSNIFYVPVPLKVPGYDASENEHPDKQECTWSARTEQLECVLLPSPTYGNITLNNQREWV